MTKKDAFKLGIAYGEDTAEYALEAADKGEIPRTRDAVEDEAWESLQNQRQYAGHPTYDFAGERNADTLYEGFEEGETRGVMRVIDKAEKAGFFEEEEEEEEEEAVFMTREPLVSTRQEQEELHRLVKKAGLSGSQASSLKSLAKALKDKFQLRSRPSEEFNGSRGGLWIQDPYVYPKKGKYADLTAFNYNAWEFDPEEKYYVMSVRKDIEQFLTKQGYYAEPYDPETWFIWPN